MTSRPSPRPDNQGPAFEALAAAMAEAATYATVASDLAAIGDARGAAYAVRACSACLLTSADLVEMVRPSRRPDAVSEAGPMAMRQAGAPIVRRGLVE
ncbi:hypothetical protein LRS73_35465 (plasmid) [Methylobacterium currus]|uniref:hypothetical protein n=1 Tax=Methylobacterium currus TaxID=2051553 RepID=UPI001E614FFF|nr:hypothetical protein [Methylobacterium currus]UHC20478.1 hypothetical protein LRS73_35465 [Methylobacterium currus]